MPIKVEPGRNLQIPKLRREVSNTENCSRPVFSAITGLRVTDLLLAQWLSGNLAGEMFHGLLFLSGTKFYYLCSLNHFIIVAQFSVDFHNVAKFMLYCDFGKHMFSVIYDRRNSRVGETFELQKHFAELEDAR